MHKVAILCSKRMKTSIESLDTVLNILNNIDGTKYNVDIIVIDNIVDIRAMISEEEFMLEPCYAPFDDIKNNHKVSNVFNLESMSVNQLKNTYDVAIIAIYNIYGEDGRLIGLLEIANVPYMSPSLKTSAICLDKSLTKKILEASKISVPEGFEEHKTNIDIDVIDKKISSYIKYPVIVKASYSGASKGINIAKNISDLKNAINEALEFSDEVLFERLLNGKEFTVGIIGHYTNAYPLPVVMIKTNNQFFDYEAKYVSGKSEEICPAPINNQLRIDIQQTAMESYKAVKADSHCRVDVIYSEGKIYVLEINTFPGLTRQSMFPKELAAAGITMSKFINNELYTLISKNVSKKLNYKTL